MTTPTNGPGGRWSAGLATTLLVLTIALGGCSLMFHHRGDVDHPANPLSDEQTKAQVIEPAKQIVQVAGLQQPDGRFNFSTCNDQGDPPYQGVVAMGFVWPGGVDRDAYINKIAATMVAHGWTDGPPPGLHPFGRVIHKEGVMAIMGQDPNGPIRLYGECRNMTDHHGDTGFSITDQLRGG